MNVPHRLGSWVCPSGNSVDVDLLVVDDTLGHLLFAWDDPPPLSRPDGLFYRAVIIPAVTRLVAEYSEQTGRTLTVTM
jgi:hypothetical protein